MNEEQLPQSEIILYQTEDGQTRIQCRFENETLWLTQKQMAELFQIRVHTVNHHLKGIFSEGELQSGATIRCYRIVQTEGSRQITREVEHYRLEAGLAVGYRVRSHRGTQFRQWATSLLSEYLVKGFTMDDERLKNPPGKGQKEDKDRLRQGMAALFPGVCGLRQQQVVFRQSIGGRGYRLVFQAKRAPTQGRPYNFNEPAHSTPPSQNTLCQ